jgi:type IV fimbrial biogenesis protein FimT
MGALTKRCSCRRETATARNRGFTLIEAMVVVAIVAILGGLATPNFRQLIGTMQAKSASFDLINDLALARSEALKRNERVRIRPAGDDGDWSRGWVVVRVLPNGTEDATPLRARDPMGSSLSISGAPNALTFRPNGRPGDDTSDANMSWLISTPAIEGVAPRCVVITPTGSARSKIAEC